MKFLLSLTKTAVTLATSSALAAIDWIDQSTTTPKKRRISTGQTEESDQAQIRELFESPGLAGIHDQQDEFNRQQAILIARFYDHLAAQDVPDELIFSLVEMKFTKMQFNSESMTHVPWDEDDDY